MLQEVIIAKCIIQAGSLLSVLNHKCTCHHCYNTVFVCLFVFRNFINCQSVQYLPLNDHCFLISNRLSAENFWVHMKDLLLETSKGKSSREEKIMVQFFTILHIYYREQESVNSTKYGMKPCIPLETVWKTLSLY